VRLWDDGQVMEIHGSADSSQSSWEQGTEFPNGDAASGVSWDVLFGDMDYAVAGELQLAG
jgi:hypothetical protein